MVNLASNSHIEYAASREIEATGGVAVQGGATLQGVQLKNTNTGDLQWFEFVGVGIGIGAGLPIGGSFSNESDWFRASGSKLLESPFAWNVDFDDLTGLGHIFTVSASLVGGQGVSIICFGESFGDPISASAFMITEGIVIGGAGVGIMAYKGHWSKSDK